MLYFYFACLSVQLYIINISITSLQDNAIFLLFQATWDLEIPLTLYLDIPWLYSGQEFVVHFHTKVCIKFSCCKEAVGFCRPGWMIPKMRATCNLKTAEQQHFLLLSSGWIISKMQHFIHFTRFRKFKQEICRNHFLTLQKYDMMILYPHELCGKYTVPQHLQLRPNNRNQT